MDQKQIDKAVKEACLVRKNAHAPYSKFQVGAILVAENGTFYKGVNVENSSFGATVCAERIALFSAVADGQREFSLLVIASSLNGKAVFPCGICRQVIADFNKDLRILLVNSDSCSIETDTTLADIFPDHFEFA